MPLYRVTKVWDVLAAPDAHEASYASNAVQPIEVRVEPVQACDICHDWRTSNEMRDGSKVCVFCPIESDRVSG